MLRILRQTGHSCLPGFAVLWAHEDGARSYVPHSAVALPSNAQPSQALTTNTGPFVITFEFPGGGHLRAFRLRSDGRLTQTESKLPPLEANDAQPLPLGTWANPRALYIYVGFVNTSEVGVHRLTEEGKLGFVTTASFSTP